MALGRVKTDEPSHARERRWPAFSEIKVNSRRPVMRVVIRLTVAMSMEHKAFEFDWHAFDADLRRVLIDALESNTAAGLRSYIDQNIHELIDPYEGNPLETDWRSQLENPNDIQELGDFALTRFYDPCAESGVGGAWLDLDESLAQQCRNAMLGITVGPPNNPFDPGRMGSYFQSPDGVIQSLDHLATVDDARLVDYLSLLGICRSENRGVYVTF